MNPIGIFYGSSTGNTEEYAKEIASLLRTEFNAAATTVDVSGIAPERLLEFEHLIIGCPTWDVGELQSDWDRLQRKLGDLSFAGRTVALFGSGDAVSYPDTFQDAIGILGKEFRDRGATLVGKWPTEGYTFDASLGVEGDYFLGLALDYDDDYRLSKERMATWVRQIVEEFGASES